MALLRDHVVFTSKFVNGLRGRGTAVANCTIEIYTKTLVDSGGANPTVNKAPVYSGSARLQPLRSTLPKDTPGSEGLVHSLQFQLPLTTAVASMQFSPGMMVKVLTSPLLAVAVGWTGVLKDVPDAPNAIERTLVAELDTAKAA